MEEAVIKEIRTCASKNERCGELLLTINDGILTSEFKRTSCDKHWHWDEHSTFLEKCEYVVFYFYVAIFFIAISVLTMGIFALILMTGTMNPVINCIEVKIICEDNKINERLKLALGHKMRIQKPRHSKIKILYQ